MGAVLQATWDIVSVSFTKIIPLVIHYMYQNGTPRQPVQVSLARWEFSFLSWFSKVQDVDAPPSSLELETVP